MLTHKPCCRAMGLGITASRDAEAGLAQPVSPLRAEDAAFAVDPDFTFDDAAAVVVTIATIDAVLDLFDFNDSD